MLNQLLCKGFQAQKVLPPNIAKLFNINHPPVECLVGNSFSLPESIGSIFSFDEFDELFRSMLQRGQPIVSLIKENSTEDVLQDGEILLLGILMKDVLI